MTTLTLPIAELDPQTPDIKIFRLALEGHPFEYQAGQSVLVSAPGEEARKAYSLASSPGETARTGRLDLAIKRSGDSRQLHDLRPGDRITIEGPYGRFVYTADPVEADLFFLAGGSGIAPLRGIIRSVADWGGPERMTLIYSARTPRDFAYAGEFRALAREGRLRALFTSTRAPSGPWAGLQGRIDEDKLRTYLPSPRALCFICGPDEMLAALAPLLRALGVAADHIRMEEW